MNLFHARMYCSPTRMGATYKFVMTMNLSHFDSIEAVAPVTLLVHFDTPFKLKKSRTLLKLKMLNIWFAGYS